MARFLMATLPITGHVYPGLPIARELVNRGHEVVWYTGARFRPKVEAVGARYEAMVEAYDFNDLELDRFFPGRAPLGGIAKLKWDFKHIFIDAGPGQVRDLERILQSFPADVIVHDVAFTGAHLLSERRSTPFATYNISAMTVSSRDTAPFGLGVLPSSSAAGRARNRAIKWAVDNLVFRDVTAHYNDVRVKLGLPRFERGGFLDVGPGPYLYLQPTVPSFEYPRSDLPPQVHFIGPFLPETPADFDPPAWWPDLKAGRKVVYVTQGTSATDSEQLIVPTLKALADEDVLVVATTGGKGVDTIKLDPLPANARVEAFVPHGHLMPHVGVMVTNGGYGGVQHALAHGIPIVASGTTEDKPEIGNRVAWSGAGLNLKATSPPPAKLKAAVRALFDDARYRENAQRLRAEIASHDAPARAADLLQELAATKRPVSGARRDAAAAASGSALARGAERRCGAAARCGGAVRRAARRKRLRGLPRAAPAPREVIRYGERSSGRRFARRGGRRGPRCRREGGPRRDASQRSGPGAISA